MPPVLHVIDRSTPPDCLGQLALLADPDDRIVSIGPPPPCGALAGRVEALHRPFNSITFCGWRMRRRALHAVQLHAWSPPAAVAALAAARGNGLPVLLTLPGRPSGRPLRALREQLHAGGLNVTVPTLSARRGLIRAGVAGEVIHVLPPATRRAEHLAERRERMRAALGIGPAERLVVSPEDMTCADGHRLAAWAHAMIREIISGVRLVIPGRGRCEGAVRHFVQTVGCSSDVLLTGDRFCQADLLAAADVAMLMSRRGVCAGAMAAAMAAGAAIIASATADARECTGGDACALLTPPTDLRATSAALLTLLENTNRAEQLSLAARTRAETQFDVSRIRQQLAEICSALDGGSDGR